MNETQKALAIKLSEIGAIKFGAFRLKLHETHPDAPLSPIYLNLRTPDNKEGPLTEEMVEAIGKEIFDVVNSAAVEFERVVGIPRAGGPFANVVSRLSGKPQIILGKKVEGDRRKIDSIISGDYRPGQPVILIDDLITQADTKKEAIKVCEEAGLRVVGVAVGVDREQGGSEELKNMGYNVYTVFTLIALLDYYVHVGEIDQRMHTLVMNYLAANR